MILGSSCLGLIGPAPQNIEGVPIDGLPGSLKDLVWEVNLKMQVPVTAALTSILAVISVSMQGRIRVRRTENLVSPVSLWFFQIQESGERKSSVLRELTKGIQRFIDEECATHRINVDTFKSKNLVWNAEMKGIESAIKKKAEKCEDITELRAKFFEVSQRKPVDPIPFKLLLNDATSEALRNCLAKCRPITSLFSDEGIALLKAGALSNIPLLNRCWDGGDVSIERASLGTLDIKDPAVSIFIAVQPKAFETFHRSKGDLLRDAGFYARSYIVQPPSYAGGRGLGFGLSGQPLIDEFNQRCYSILRDHLTEDGGMKERIVLGFEPLANFLWQEAFKVWEWNMGASGFFRDDKDLAAKQAEKVARIAACIHYFTSDCEMISEQSMRAAIDIGNWYLDSTIRAIKKESEPSEFELDYQVLSTWFEKWFSVGSLRRVRTSHILQCGPHRLRNAARLNKVLDAMAGRGLLRYVYGTEDNARWVELCFSSLRLNPGI